MRLVLSAIACGLIAGLSTPFWGGVTGQEPSAFAAGPPDTVESLQLPVPRSFDLAHVEPEHFAVALGKDPQRIFAFVRDQIAYEVYEGYLRGPRGTLLALAGNSVDQAALLGSLLEHAGQRVRYVRGMLAEVEAEKLVSSMWAERPRAAPARAVDEPSPKVKAALETLRRGVERDYNLIRDHLKRIGHVPGPEAVTSRGSLVKEAQAHYWVQWWNDGAWMDMDPSMAESSIGETFAPAGTPFEAFPEELFHRVEIRIRLEEYTGDRPSSRVILRYSAKAAELSGAKLGLIHMLENWTGPASSPAEALSAAIEDTGRIKPVLIVEAEVTKGMPFRQTAPPRTGLQGIGTLLAGAGTRDPVPIATAEWVEFEFIYPGGRTEKVTREVFDTVGAARRASGKGLTAAEVGERSEGENAVILNLAIYNLLFSTGRINAIHLPRGLDDATNLDLETPDLLAALRQFGSAFVTTSDALLPRIDWPQAASVLFYPDSPRLVIAEFSTAARTPRISLDLRRVDVRTASLDARPEYAFAARIYRGVVNGTLERVLMERVTAAGRANGELGSVMSTSTLFDRAQAAGISIVAQSNAPWGLDGDVPKDALARLRGDVARGYIAMVPQRALPVDDRLRLAWWRVDPRSGETTAVTDEGLHQVTTAYVHHNQRNQTTTVTVRQYVGGQYVPESETALTYMRAAPNASSSLAQGFEGGVYELTRDLRILREAGVRVINAWPPPL